MDAKGDKENSSRQKSSTATYLVRTEGQGAVPFHTSCRLVVTVIQPREGSPLPLAVRCCVPPLGEAGGAHRQPFPEGFFPGGICSSNHANLLPAHSPLPPHNSKPAKKKGSASRHPNRLPHLPYRRFAAHPPEHPPPDFLHAATDTHRRPTLPRKKRRCSHTCNCNLHFFPAIDDAEGTGLEDLPNCRHFRPATPTHYQQPRPATACVLLPTSCFLLPS